MNEFCERPKMTVAPSDKSELCMKCGKKLQRTDIGLHKKLIHRYAREFMCVDCLSEYVKVPKRDLLDKAEYFKQQGCSFFR